MGPGEFERIQPRIWVKELRMVIGARGFRVSITGGMMTVMI